MIEAADELFRSRGYLGTALTDIVSASNTPRGSIYFHFPGGKEEVAVAVTQVASAALEDTVDRAVAAATAPGDIPRLVAANLAGRLNSSDYKDGCALAPVVLEMATESEVLREACDLAFDRWRSRLVSGYQGYGINVERAQDLATMTISTLEGALVIARAQQNVQSIIAMGEELAAQVDVRHRRAPKPLPRPRCIAPLTWCSPLDRGAPDSQRGIRRRPLALDRGDPAVDTSVGIGLRPSSERSRGVRTIRQRTMTSNVAEAGCRLASSSRFTGAFVFSSTSGPPADPSRQSSRTVAGESQYGLSPSDDVEHEGYVRGAAPHAPANPRIISDPALLPRRRAGGSDGASGEDPRPRSLHR